MYLSEDYLVFELHHRGEERLNRELERRRLIAERATENEAPQVTDVSRPPFLVRWRRRLALLTAAVSGSGHHGGPTPVAS
ncbi:hypothetical protein [Agromyces cerinus]|uniref:Uncharacterized protein n=1 Tax=Agromyces cerinus subsp. cerinus TaxID=232089 RepID=A0A1N6I3K3_9MICO|nr:hypothetical protein [Agromyces cerinus]SIO26561.1 hypothetical protein SAMN05443544_3635 [Agromyces cerinus subsp. cerinus]